MSGFTGVNKIWLDKLKSWKWHRPWLLFVAQVLMSGWALQAQITDCQTVNKNMRASNQYGTLAVQNAAIHHVLCKTNAQLSLRDHIFLWGPKACEILKPFCVYVYTWVCRCVWDRHIRPPSLQYSPCSYPGQSSIKPLIGEGGPGYTLCCWHPDAKNSRLHQQLHSLWTVFQSPSLSLSNMVKFQPEYSFPEFDHVFSCAQGTRKTSEKHKNRLN